MVKKPNKIMSEFFLELFSEEIPVNLQKNTREILLQNFKDFFEKEDIVSSGKSFSFSTPNRVLILFNRLNKEVIKKSEEINPEIARLQSSLSSHFGTKIVVKSDTKNKGNISIPFVSLEDLNRILEILDIDA